MIFSTHRLSILRSVKTAMHYQHPELEIVRAALDYNPADSPSEMRV
jgi:hypothetical protein